MHHHHHQPHPSVDTSREARREARQKNRRRLAIVLGLSASYMVAEFFGGLLTGSLALLADAGHLASDVGALALSLTAIWTQRSHRRRGRGLTPLIAPRSPSSPAR